MSPGKSPVVRKNPQALAQVVERFKALASREIAVGFPAGNSEAYPDGTSVVEVASRHVYGVGVPQRDFMALAKPAVEAAAKPFLQEIAKLAVGNGRGHGDESAVEALQEAAGQAAQAEIRNAIVALDTPPNAPSTIAAKGSSNPLIDTGHMKDSVTYVVRDRR